MRTLVGTALLLAMTGVVVAADFPSNYYYAAPPPLAYSWAGPYIGGNLGYEWGTINNNPTRPSGIAGGAQGGFNWQQGAFVYGGEADFQLSAAKDTSMPWQFSNNWFGTVRGRAGLAINNFLVYGTAGLAYGSLTANSAANLSEMLDSIGWTAGLGVEFGFAPHWSAKAEWLYLDLAERSFSVTGANNGLNANLLRLGVNYHF
jgi:outer membrane immunogenic protein